jgi:NADH-quinone oxidoreductase subunit E
MGCCGNDFESNFPLGKVDLTQLDSMLEKYGKVSGSLITILQKTQDTYGYLPLEALRYIASKTGLKPAQLFGVATFYTQFRMEPVGKYVILLCQGTACHVNGSKKIESVICEELKIEEGQTTEDGVFTLENVACLGCCSLAPVMMINGETYGKLTPDLTRNIIRDIYKQEKDQ